MTKVFSLLITLLIASSVFAQQKEVLNVEDFKKRIKKGELIILDVRTPEEYADGHIKNAINIDWKNPEEFQAKATQLHKTKPVYVYCHSGIRSQKAYDWLRSNGFTNVVGLDGGMEAWKKAGKRVSKMKQN
jgi:rhodanese-related sulfurtransferase